MGIYDRDYMRKYRPSAGLDSWSLKQWLTIAILAVSLLSSMFWFTRNSGLWRWMRPKHEKMSLVVNINTATQTEIATLPNIGPTRAKMIIAKRPYDSVDELAKVSGIGAKQIEALRPLVKTKGCTERR